MTLMAKMDNGNKAKVTSVSCHEIVNIMIKIPIIEVTEVIIAVTAWFNELLMVSISLVTTDKTSP